MVSTFKAIGLRLFLLLSILSATAGSTLADAGDPRVLIMQTAQQLLDTVEAEKDIIQKDPARVKVLIRQIVIPYVDFERISRWVLGKYWRTARPDQRSRFIHEFQAVLIRTYAAALLEHTDIKIEYPKIRIEPGSVRAVVRSLVPRTGAPPVQVNYSMHRSGGNWQVYDVTIEGISLVTNYRQAFTREISRLGLDGLIQKLAERNQPGGNATAVSISESDS